MMRKGDQPDYGVFCWLLLLLLLGLVDKGSPFASSRAATDQCGYTRYPSLCLQSLLVGHHQNDDNVVSALINHTLSETTNLPVSNFAQLGYHFITLEAQHTRIAAEYCHKLMMMSQKQLNQALSALRESPRKHKHDIQTWLSAALTFQQTCRDVADIHATSNELMSQTSQKMDYLSKLCSNSLALVNRINGSTSKKTRRVLVGEEDSQLFPSWVLAGDRKLLVETDGTAVKANAVVAKDGSGNYETISAAIKAANGKRFVIYVKAGVYKEKINTEKDEITLIGEGKDTTIIVGDDSVAGGNTLKGSATFTIFGNGFIARDISFRNTAGPNGEQAVALTIASDHSVLYRCSISGYQDTLYALSLRQFYRECDIYGTVDFIFGNAAAVFQNCYIVLRRPHTRGSYNVILANGRSDPGQATGFSLQNCKIVAGSDLAPVKGSFNSYLGRGWREYSRSVIMQSMIDGAITPRGWIEWDGAKSNSLRTVYFAEYMNVGPGAGTSRRVQWPGFHVIGKEEAVKFTVGNFLGGASWLPSTGVIFDTGL
ncbi:hypothetical protein LguiA_003072 [Lonicera macranthoides]